MRLRVVSLALVLSFLSLARAESPPAADRDRDSIDEEAYPLDLRPREVPPEQRRLRCDQRELVTYRGTTLRYAVPIRIHAAFVPIIQRFEAIAREIGAMHYGRPPRSLSHAGSYNCRTIRGARHMLSEHALGNALDLRGFNFPPLRGDETLPAMAQGRLRHGFQVRVKDHWDAEAGVEAYHADFFRHLRARLEAEPDLFHVMLGPSFPGHTNHLHLDRAPWRFVQF